MTAPRPHPRWFHPTPDRLVLLLLGIEGCLWLSERFRWVSFNQHKGWTVLIAVATVGVFLLLMLLWLVAALLWRFRFQYSIRSLLVLTVAVAIPFSWLGVEMKKAKEQKEAVEAIEKLGGFVAYDYQLDASEDNPFAIKTEGTKPPGPTWLRRLLGDEFFANVVDVVLHGSDGTDAALEHLKGLSQLQSLYLDETGATDAGLARLKGLGRLQGLDLGSRRSRTPAWSTSKG